MRAFLAACGSDGPLIVGLEKPGRSAVSWRIFDQPFLTIGSDPTADLVLVGDEVSGRHAYVQVVAGRLFVVDLHSRNGTHWSNESGLWGWLPPNSGIGIGPYRLRSRTSSIAPAVPTLASTALPVPVSRGFHQPDVLDLSLEFAGGPGKPMAWRMSRSLVLLGSSSACRVRLQGPEIHSIHASLLRTPAGCYLVDLLTQGGTRVNGESVRFARLRDHDLISIGTYRIRVRIADQIEPPGLADQHALPVRADQTGTLPAWSDLAETDRMAAMIRSIVDDLGQNQAQTAARFQQSIMGALQSFATIHGEQMSLIRAELDQIRRLTEEHLTLRQKVADQAAVNPSRPMLRLVDGTPGSRAEPNFPAWPIPDAPILTLKPAQVPPRSVLASRTGSNPVAAHDLHGQIMQRLEQIQEERQGRWQKLLKTLFD